MTSGIQDEGAVKHKNLNMALSRLSSTSNDKGSISPIKGQLSPKRNKFDTFNSFHNLNDRKTLNPLKQRPREEQSTESAHS